ncbi:UbiA family prenyltransferase [Halopelagius longus]|uniref:4-hydroxybenzoate polyprenyltransferase n=1 Tax=Halopelagius longus TaxID=1236180 RepID=A0A1H0XZT5_9EURY|nr:UbiA family prenyltransferase [Halopelagius longus]RDI72196.1 4-hydroxybenzoate polyprenyltransferase [Halopelagius longus]SDQ08355.1 UbiA prenyltransferase family protein [Halopelagius longus]
MVHDTQSLSNDPDRAASMQSRLTEWARRRGESWWDALVYSSAYLALIAMAEVAVVMSLLSLPSNAAPVVVGLVTFAVYTSDRIADADTDAVSNPRQAAFVRRHRDELYVLASLAYGLAVALSVLGGPVALAITLLPGAFWVLYASDWVPESGLPFHRLKEVLLVNSAVVAFAWAATLTFLPLAFADAAFTPTAAVVFAYFFLATFVNAEIPNVRDVEGDAAIGVSTLPVVFGVRRTRQALYGVNLAVVALAGYAAFSGYVSVAAALALLVGAGYSCAVTSLLGRTEREGALVLAAECTFLFVFVTLGIVRLLPV